MDEKPEEENEDQPETQPEDQPEIQPVEPLPVDSEQPEVLPQEDAPVDVDLSIDPPAEIPSPVDPDDGELVDTSMLYEPPKPAELVEPRPIDNDSRKAAVESYGRMSYYKEKNAAKGRKIPGEEKKQESPDKGPEHSGEELDEEGLARQQSVNIDDIQGKHSNLNLGVDMMPDIIPDLGVDGPSSFKPTGQGSNQMQGAIDSASDSLDTVAQGIADTLARLTANMKKANDRIVQLMDKLEVEDMRDEF